jgi:hypothetical protein
MKKVFLIVIGFIVLCSSVVDLFTGQTLGFGTTAIQGAQVSFNDNPLEFILHIVIRFFGSIWAIKVGFSSKPLDDD